MSLLKNLLLLILTFFFLLSKGQSPVSIFILDSSTKVDSTIVSNTYTQNGFAPNITIAPINTSLSVNNYKIAFISEGYSYDDSISDFSGNFLSENERQIIENFVEEGGHVVWSTENWNNYPSSFASYQTVNNVYETNIIEGAFFNNLGIGPPHIFRIHPSMGPSGLSLTETVSASGSYSTMLNVPNCNKLYTSDITDNSGNDFNECSHTVLAVFPARPKPNEGSVVLSSELGLPFKPFIIWGGMEPYSVFNEELDSSIAVLHYKLIVEENTDYLNNWSDNYSNMNANCPTNVASFELSDTIVCVGDTIFFTHKLTNEVIFYTSQDSGYIRLTLMNNEVNGSCYDDSIVLVRFINPLVDVGNDKTVCEGDEIILKANNPSNATLSWSNGVIDNQAFIPEQTQSYSIESSLLGCSSTDSLTINVIKKPVIALNLANNTSFCKGDEILLNAQTTTEANLVWNNGITNNEVFTAENTKTYVIRANVGNCSSVDSLRIIIKPTPKINAGDDVNVCKGEIISLNAIATPSSSIVSWNKNISNGDIFTPFETTSYTVEAILAGCSKKDSLVVTVLPLPIPKYEVEINRAIENYTQIHFLNATSGAENNSYIWDFGDSTNQTSEFSPSHLFNSLETKFVDVKLTVTNQMGCIDSVIKTFRIDKNTFDFVYVPTAFTPNSDQTNDTFKPIFNNPPREYEFNIYNRWGEIMFETDKVELGWNGMFKNRIVQDGVYVYKILHNKKVISGNFSIFNEQ